MSPAESAANDRAVASAAAAIRGFRPAARGRGRLPGRGGLPTGGAAKNPRPSVLGKDAKAPSQRSKYHRQLIYFMEHRNSTTYPENQSFTPSELLQITPREIYRWMASRAYGTEDPSPEHDPPKCRACTIAFDKKALSYFMPNKGASWVVSSDDPEKGMGNPTKAPLVNGLIKAMKRNETKGLGKDSREKTGLRKDSRANEQNDRFSFEEVPIPRDGEHGDGATGGNPALRQTPSTTQQWRASILSKTNAIQVAVNQMHKQQIAEFAILKRGQKKLEEMIRGMIDDPARRAAGPGIVAPVTKGDARSAIQTGVPVATGDLRPATLSACPRTIGSLWYEYQFGIDGRKPAKKFTISERGRKRNKYKYCKRLPLWKCMKRLCDSGCTVNAAIERIKLVYGDIIVSRLLVKIARDERRGGHESLRT